jgi:hypothetical protein
MSLIMEVKRGDMQDGENRNDFLKIGNANVSLEKKTVGYDEWSRFNIISVF